MRKPLHRNTITALFFSIAIPFIASTVCHAQVIVETFDESAAPLVLTTGKTYTTAGTNTLTSAGISVGTSSQVIAATSVSTITVTNFNTTATSLTSSTTNGGGTRSNYTTDYYTTSTTGGVTSYTTTTGGPDSAGTYTWYYGASAASGLTISSSTSGFHSNKYYLDMLDGSFIITPTVPQGICMVSFWIINPSGGNVKTIVGLKTNLTCTPVYPVAFGGTDGVTKQFTALTASSATNKYGVTYTTNDLSTITSTRTNGATGLTTGANTGTDLYPISSSQIIFSVPASLQNLPGQVAIVLSSTSGEAYIDDIQIFSPVSIALGTNPTVCYSSGSQTANLPYTGKSCNATQYTISGWSGGGFSNVTGAALSSSPIAITVPAGVATGTYTATLTVSDGTIVSPNYAISVTVNSANTWLGTSSADWNTAANWSCGVPSSTDVIIPKVTPAHPQPVLSSNASVYNITLNSGATVSLHGYTLTVNGASGGTGTVSGSATSGLSFGSSATGTVNFTSTSDTLNTLTLTDGANITLGSSLDITSTGTVTVGSSTGATLATGGFLTLLSDNSGWARVAAVPVNGLGISQSTISGNVTVQSYIHSSLGGLGAHRAWRLITAPVTNSGASPIDSIYNAWQNNGVYTAGIGTMITCPPALANSSNGMDAGISGSYSAYTWNVGSQSLVAVSNTKRPISTATGSADNIGYFIFIRGDRNPLTLGIPSIATVDNTTLSCNGPLQLGDQKFASTSGALSATANGLSLVSNPYACSIDFSELAGDKSGYTSGLINIVNRYYVWNSNLTGSQALGGYVCIDDAGYGGSYIKSIGGSGTATAADLSIQSGQAFFVQTNTTAASSVTFKEIDKSTTNNYVYRPEEVAGTAPLPESFTGTLSLLNSDSSTALTDGVIAQYQSGYCNCVDYVDAPKFSNVDEMFSLARDGHQLCIERRAELAKHDTLFLNLKQMAQRAYQFKFTSSFINHPSVGVHLEDAYTGTHTSLNMNGSSTVNFMIDNNAASKDTGRFKVVFGAVNITPSYTTLKATRENNVVLVEWLVSNDQSMENYVLLRSTDGVNYTPVDTTLALHSGQGYTWIDTDPVAGRDYYKILSIDSLNEEAYSAVVSVGIKSLTSTSIIVYPNPIHEGDIGLAMNNMPVGKYSYTLSDNLGQAIQSGTFAHPGGNANMDIPLSRPINKGLYHLLIVQPDQTTVTVSVVY